MGDRAELGHKLAFVDVQSARRFVGKTPRSDFRGPRMIENVRLPGVLDAVRRTAGTDPPGSPARISTRTGSLP